jgi:hypothetical protein
MILGLFPQKIYILQFACINNTNNILKFIIMYSQKNLCQNYLILNFDNVLIVFIHHPPILVTRIDMLILVNMSLSNTYILGACDLVWLQK